MCLSALIYHPRVSLGAAIVEIVVRLRGFLPAFSKEQIYCSSELIMQDMCCEGMMTRMKVIEFNVHSMHFQLQSDTLKVTKGWGWEQRLIIMDGLKIKLFEKLV